jgi:hypothetical protein
MLGRAWKQAASAGQELRANIRILDRKVSGKLSNIANQPEPSGWWTGNIKEYATIVAIDGTPEALRPGMTAECEILVETLKDVLIMPVAAVVERQGKHFCWVITDSGAEKRPLVVGSTNDKFVEVKDGVTEGDEVVLNPRSVIKEEREAKEGTEEDAEKGKSAEDGAAGPAGGPKAGSSAPKATGGVPGEKQSPGAAGPPSGSGPPGAAEGKPPGGGPPGGAGAPKGRSMDLMQFDTDGDGKISKDEAPGPMQQFFDTVDANSDGFIDKAEMAKIRQMMGNRGGKPPGEGP